MGRIIPYGKQTMFETTNQIGVSSDAAFIHLLRWCKVTVRENHAKKKSMLQTAEIFRQVLRKKASHKSKSEPISTYYLCQPCRAYLHTMQKCKHMLAQSWIRYFRCIIWEMPQTGTQIEELATLESILQHPVGYSNIPTSHVDTHCRRF